MQAQFKTAFEAGAQGDDIILAITESQLTSYLSEKFDSEETPLFTEPGAFLRDGKMTIYGKARQGYLVATIKIVISAGIDATGQPDMRIEIGRFLGPSPCQRRSLAVFRRLSKRAYTGCGWACGNRVPHLSKLVFGTEFMVMVGKVK